jgi:hypothetical protein
MVRYRIMEALFHDLKSLELTQDSYWHSLAINLVVYSINKRITIFYLTNKSRSAYLHF